MKQYAGMIEVWGIIKRPGHSSYLCQFPLFVNLFPDFNAASQFPPSLLQSNYFLLMCDHNILFYNENTGCVIKCRTCHRIQVGFGILSMTFDETGFEAFRCTIEKNLCERKTMINPYIKSVLIPSPCEGMDLLLSLHELESLHDILEQADNEMKALTLISEFQQSDRC